VGDFDRLRPRSPFSPQGIGRVRLAPLRRAGAVVAIELGEDPSDVRLGGKRADHQPARDVRVAEAGGNELEDLAFPLGELGQLRGRRLRVGARRELGDQPSRDRGGEQGFAGGNDPDRVQQLTGAGVLEQKPLAPARSAA
jgi:hypothetical protein